MFNMTENENTKGWESITPTRRPINRLRVLSLAAWKLAALMVDEGREWDEIKRMQDTAQELEDLANRDAECHCILPEQSCDVCRATARYIYNERTQADK